MSERIRSHEATHATPLSRVGAGLALSAAFVSGYATSRTLDSLERTEVVIAEETHEQRINRQQDHIRKLIVDLLDEATYTEIFSIVSDSISNFEKKHPNRHRSVKELAEILDEEPTLFEFAFDTFTKEMDTCIEEQSCTAIDAAFLQKIKNRYVTTDLIRSKLKALRLHESKKSQLAMMNVSVQSHSLQDSKP